MKPAPRLPKARVMYANAGPWGLTVHDCKLEALHEEDEIQADSNSEATHIALPSLVTPCLTAKEAAAKKKWANTDADEKAERMAIAFYEQSAGKGEWAKTNAHLRTWIRLGMFAVLEMTGEPGPGACP